MNLRAIVKDLATAKRQGAVHGSAWQCAERAQARHCKQDGGRTHASRPQIMPRPVTACHGRVRNFRSPRRPPRKRMLSPRLWKGLLDPTLCPWPSARTQAPGRLPGRYELPTSACSRRPTGLRVHLPVRDQLVHPQILFPSFGHALTERHTRYIRTRYLYLLVYIYIYIYIYIYMVQRRSTPPPPPPMVTPPYGPYYAAFPPRPPVVRVVWVVRLFTWVV